MELFYTILFLFIFISILIIFSGWFASTETALTNLSDLQIANIKQKNGNNIEYILKLKENLNETIISILIGNNIVNILLSSITAIVADSLFDEIGVTIMVFIITFLIIVFGDITPKSYAILENEKIVKKNAKRIYYLVIILKPLTLLFIFISRNILKLAKVKQRTKKLLVTNDSIIELASLGHQQGVIKMMERDIIHRVLKFGDTRCEDIMIPMKNVFSIKEKSSLDEAKKLISKSGFTRIPVMNNKKKVIGIICAKDLLSKKEGSLTSYIRKIKFVPKYGHITRTLSLIQEEKTHIVVVRDKIKRHIGIITLEDIMEELVGEIYDEYTKEQLKSINQRKQVKK